MEYFIQIKEKWLSESIENIVPATIEQIAFIEKKYNVQLPVDFKDYFKLLNGTSGEYTDKLFEFYAVERVRNVFEEFNDWKGIPDYQNLENNTLTENLFVFGNYNFNLFAYAIRLFPDQIISNEVYIICGKNLEKIADSFSGFIKLYLEDSIELYFNS